MLDGDTNSSSRADESMGGWGWRIFAGGAYSSRDNHNFGECSSGPVPRSRTFRSFPRPFALPRPRTRRILTRPFTFH